MTRRISKKGPPVNRKADNHNPDNRKTDARKADTRKANTRKANTRKANTRKTDAHKADTRKPEKRGGPAVKPFHVKEPAELLTFLLSVHPGQGRNAVKAMLARGQVSVRGSTVTAYNHPLAPGDEVTIRKGKPPEAMHFVGLAILHEDDDVIVIRKEAGLLSIATAEEKELTAYRQLMEYVRKQDPSNRIFVLHRLDRDTSGVMMFARSEEVQQKMQSAWKDVVHERTYTALVEGQVRTQEGTVESWLKANAAMKVYSSTTPDDGQHAITHYKLLRSTKTYSLLEIRLETGRKNQIRVHMHDIGHPIAGDKKYGAKTKPIGRLGLHANVLAFVHPSSEELVRFEAPVPKAFLSVF